ncbi:MAG: flagellar motor protein MotB [Myxococcota bacterium]
MADECDCEEGAPPWMATFSDLATLLLTFFVLLLSFAEMDVTEFKELLGSVREAFGVQFRTRGHHEALSDSPVSIGDEPPGAVTAVSAELAEEIRGKLEEAGVEEDVDVEVTSEGIVVRIRDQVLFPVGSDTLTDDAQPILEVVAGITGAVATHGAVIEGHTDDRPIHTSRFPSNWELSTARATKVLRHFLQRTDLDPGQLSAAGYADTRPLVPNDSAENRARNRRVEFLFRRPLPVQEDEPQDTTTGVIAPGRRMPNVRESPEDVKAEHEAAEAAAWEAQEEAAREEAESRQTPTPSTEPADPDTPADRPSRDRRSSPRP